MGCETPSLQRTLGAQRAGFIKTSFVAALGNRLFTLNTPNWFYQIVFLLKDNLSSIYLPPDGVHLCVKIKTTKV